jgi:hypothetical protein
LPPHSDANQSMFRAKAWLKANSPASYAPVSGSNAGNLPIVPATTPTDAAAAASKRE